MGDTIVLWRTWMLCPDQKLLVFVPITLWFGGLCVYDAPTSLHLSMSTAALSAATNFFSTILISWKAWQRRASFNISTAGEPNSRASKIMSLIIESGFIYFVLWIIEVLNFYVKWKVPNLQAAHMTWSLCGIYPTLIIIAVHLDYTFWDCTSTSPRAKTLGTGVFSTIAPSMRSAPRMGSTQSTRSVESNNIEKRSRWSRYWQHAPTCNTTPHISDN
ncbi:hypothetical protein B0H19DRAFT_1182806 [Mycena capillaripes]|nr:hypothetical protein B0H19DRAFT_1182806 [Mycena capillaripes]